MYISRLDGRELTEIEHVAESVIDILTTRKNTRIILGAYGCSIFDLIDEPMNADLVINLRIAIVEALDRWEPRLQLLNVDIDTSAWAEGVLSVSLQGRYIPTGKPVSFDSLELRYRSIEDNG